MNNTQTITTQGMKYTGSKLKLLPHILSVVNELLNVNTPANLPANLPTNLPANSDGSGTEASSCHILDGFSGTTRVSQALAQSGYTVTSSDISVWSETFGNCFLLAKKEKSFYQEMIDELNSLDGTKGWFTENYSVDYGELKKSPFQTKNLMKLDAIRDRIDTYHLDPVDSSVLLTSLVLALDRVDSTLGHFSSYLADWSPRSYNDMTLTVPEYQIYQQDHRVIRGDIFDVIGQGRYDLAYFDPPYGSNNEKMPPSRVRYASYYHFWTTVILNDHPKLFGKVHRREDTRDLIAGSVFEEFRKDENGRFIATEAIRKLIEKTNARYIVFSYSNGGRATKDELYDIFNSCGRLIRVMEIDYKSNVMSTMKWTNEWLNGDRKNTEYLFIIEKHPE